MNSIKRNRAFLEVLNKAKPQLRRLIIKHADKQLINCLRLTCYNILRGNLRLKPRERTRLKPYRAKLHRLYRAKPERARRELIQSGGFLGALISAVISGIAALIASR